uniref:Nucleotide exchange factor Fes1 domain-containing protein n=1 Tax=Haptolina ericina TaxID=156174 RepID=A0A7S3B124_9EUKA
MSGRTLQHEDEQVALPSEVREENTAFTSVYTQGKLVYDGAAARAGEQAAIPTSTAGEVPTSLNEMLKWGVTNSDPEELKRMAAGGAAPKPMDKEIMDMLLGEPIVAKMRACLTKLGSEGELPEGVDTALGALEELEYYVEDIDNAVDMAKIGGIPILLACLTHGTAATEPEVREMACSVLAAALQNNPKVQEAALAHNVPAALLALLRDSADDDDASLPVQRKALLAISALYRSSDQATDALLTTDDGVTTLVQVGASADPKLRRRGLFLLLQISRARPEMAALLLAATTLPLTLLEAAGDADEDTREQGLQLLLQLSSMEGEGATDAAGLRVKLIELGASGLLAKALSINLGLGDERNTEHDAHFRSLIAWLSGAD